MMTTLPARTGNRSRALKQPLRSLHVFLLQSNAISCARLARICPWFASHGKKYDSTDGANQGELDMNCDLDFSSSTERVSP